MGRASNRKKHVEWAAVLSIGRGPHGGLAFSVAWYSLEARDLIEVAAQRVGKTSTEVLRGMAQYLYATEGEGDYQMSTDDLRPLVAQA